MAANGNDGRNRQGSSADLNGVTFGNVDFADRALVARIRERDLEAAEVRIKEAVRRLQQMGVLDAEGRRVNKELPPEMRGDSLGRLDSE